jgi:hypothetical protein
MKNVIVFSILLICAAQSNAKSKEYSDVPYTAIEDSYEEETRVRVDMTPRLHEAPFRELTTPPDIVCTGSQCREPDYGGGCIGTEFEQQFDIWETYSCSGTIEYSHLTRVDSYGNVKPASSLVQAIEHSFVLLKIRQACSGNPDAGGIAKGSCTKTSIYVNRMGVEAARQTEVVAADDLEFECRFQQ